MQTQSTNLPSNKKRPPALTGAGARKNIGTVDGVKDQNNKKGGGKERGRSTSLKGYIRK